jgi:protein JBTS26
VVRLLLHSSWGDRFFIGLNGIEVFNEKGENVTTRHLLQVRAEPSSICQLQGCEQDKRVVGNLVNGRNRTAGEGDIWLAPLLSDVERIEKGPNLLLLEYSKPVRLSAINLYNYSKTPARGVREVEVFLDQSLLYRVLPS